MANFKHNVTELEIQGLIGICTNQYNSASFKAENKNAIVGDYQWSFGANTFDKPRTFSGVVGSLARKGLAQAANNGDESSVCITEAGWEALEERGLIPGSVEMEAESNKVEEVAPTVEVNVTELEIQGLIGVCESEYHDYNLVLANKEHIVGHWIWSFSANVFPKERTFSGVVSSLSKKGLIETSETDGEGIICITEAGWDALVKRNLIPAEKVVVNPQETVAEATTQQVVEKTQETAPVASKEFVAPFVLMFVNNKGETVFETRNMGFPLPRKGEQVLVPTNKGVSMVSSVDFVVNDYITGSIRIHLSS